jgi:hypothetical protein
LDKVPLLTGLVAGRVVHDIDGEVRAAGAARCDRRGDSGVEIFAARFLHQERERPGSKARIRAEGEAAERWVRRGRRRRGGSRNQKLAQRAPTRPDGTPHRGNAVQQGYRSMPPQFVGRGNILEAVVGAGDNRHVPEKDYVDARAHLLGTRHEGLKVRATRV